MKYNYLVKHNGIYYQAGEEVPDGKETKSVSVAEVIENTKKVEPEKKEEPKFDVSELEEVKEEEKKYSKTDIMKMPKGTLETLMNQNGIEITEDMSNADMKKALVAHYGL